MKKKFNITGVCYPHLHYMMDISQKMRETMAMVEGGEYFIINRPRQYGKTTTLSILEKSLITAEDYLPIRMNFQGVDRSSYDSDQAFSQMFLNLVQRPLKFLAPDTYAFLKATTPIVQDMDTLSDTITDLVHQLNKKVVLLIDEVDASTNHDPFISFLGMLRTKYLERFSPQHATFHSVVLAGVHDIKTLKQKIRPIEDGKLLSPWNIAADFKVRMSFNEAEIAPMLEEYSQVEGVLMDIPAMTKRLFYYTAGYPFLISKLCKIIAEDLLPQKEEKKWIISEVDKAVQLLIKENNTNFDSLIKNLENNKDLYKLVYRVLIEGENIPSNPHEPTISLGQLYGIFKLNGTLKIHNRVYEQCIYNFMIAKTIVNVSKGTNFAGHFLLPNKELDMKTVLLQFQKVMKEQHSLKTRNFLEEQGRLIFLAYLAPILNGQGYSFKEVQASLEKRLDVVVTYFQHRYIIELKRWYGPKAHLAGLDQLADYLDIHQVDKGYLLIFETRKNRTWATQTIVHKGKEVFAVWV